MAVVVATWHKPALEYLLEHDRMAVR